MRSNYLAFIVLALIVLSVILTQRVLLISSDNTNAPDDEKTASSTTRDKIKSVIGNILHSVAGHNKTTRHSSSNVEASSPREGTDIHQDNHHVILKCRNQSQCIVPDLQLLVKFKVYFCTKGVHQGYRFFFLVKEGLLLHPNVELVSFQNISQADLIVYLPGRVLSLSSFFN